MLSPSPSPRWSVLLCHLGSVHVRLASSNVDVSVPRRGRNLTERYRTLENTMSEHVSQLSAVNNVIRAPVSSSPDILLGFVIPQEPRPPADDECCMSGCAVCVYDLYEDALVAYKDSVTKLRAALSARQIPETDWPAHIRTGTTKHTLTTTEKSRGVVLDAFEEMERALKEKRDKRAAVEAEKMARGDELAEDVGGLESLRRVCEAIGWLTFPSR